ncbi:MAG TPA: deoxyribonuclease IV [Candidatus Limnocylindria bacterium]
MAGTVARGSASRRGAANARSGIRGKAPREPRRRLSWPSDAPPVGIHLGVAGGLLKAARRARQIGATALQIFGDNPTAWRRRPEPPRDAEAFVAYCAQNGIGPISIHASYLINLAGSAEPFATQSREGLLHEMQRAPAYGATLVNTHIGSHRGLGHAAGIRRVAEHVAAILVDSPASVQLVLENSAGGGDNIGASLEDLAAILDAASGLGSDARRLGFCLDTAHLWGAGHDISTAEGVTRLLDRFDELIGLDRLRLVHLNDSRSELGSRNDRHEHLGSGRIGAEGLGAMLRDPRVAGHAAVMLETPGVDDGYDAVNMRRARLLYGGALTLPVLPPGAFKLNRRSTRAGPGERVKRRAQARRAVPATE